MNPNPYGGQKRAAGKVYVPKIYGFRVSERAKCGPRMQWMRLRPENADELDLVDWRGHWIDDDEHYGDEEEPADEDRPMEDFDPVRCTTRWNHTHCTNTSHRMRKMMTMTRRKRRKRRRRKARH